MTSTASEPDASVDAACRLEVATTAADVLRAQVRVVGDVDDDTVGVVAGILLTHLRAGRRYLRVDLAGSGVAGAAVADCLGELHRQVEAVGGMLVFDHADPRFGDTAATHGLYWRTSD